MGFVERLTLDQQRQVAKSILQESAIRYNLEMHFGEESFLEMYMYGWNHSIYLYDTYLTCKHNPYNRDIKKMAKKAFKALYDIFGEEYKEYYLKEANNIFTEEVV